MAKGQQRDATREAKWREILARHGKSGLTVRAFCRREGLPESAWYAWRRTIQQRDAQRPAFVPVQLHPEAAREADAIVVELRGGRVLRLPLSMPPAQLAALVHAIERSGDAA